MTIISLLQRLNTPTFILGALLALTSPVSHADELAVQQISAQLGGQATSASKDVSFPDAKNSWQSSPVFADINQLRRMGHGLTKNQVRELISYPHFSEGLFGTSVWNYLFAFRIGKADEAMVCQYQVHFDNNRLVTAIFWNRAECADLLKPAIR